MDLPSQQPKMRERRSGAEVEAGEAAVDMVRELGCPGNTRVARKGG